MSNKNESFINNFCIDNVMDYVKQKKKIKKMKKKKSNKKL